MSDEKCLPCKVHAVGRRPLSELALEIEQKLCDALAKIPEGLPESPAKDKMFDDAYDAHYKELKELGIAAYCTDDRFKDVDKNGIFEVWKGTGICEAYVYLREVK